MDDFRQTCAPFTKLKITNLKRVLVFTNIFVLGDTTTEDHRSAVPLHHIEFEDLDLNLIPSEGHNNRREERKNRFNDNITIMREDSSDMYRSTASFVASLNVIVPPRDNIEERMRLLRQQFYNYENYNTPSSDTSSSSSDSRFSDDNEEQKSTQSEVQQEAPINYNSINTEDVKKILTCYICYGLMSK